MFHAPPPQAPPPQAPPTRESVLRFLLTTVDNLSSSFFSIYHPKDRVEWMFRGVIIGIWRRTISYAKPTNIAYEVRMPKELLFGPEALAHLQETPGTPYLLAYVTYPKDDTEANRAAFRAGLEQLASSNSRELVQVKA